MAPVTMKKNELFTAYAAWAAVCVFWGTTYLAIRIGVEVLPPALFAGIRFLIAGVIFVPILLLSGHTLPKRKDLPHIAIVGIALLGIANGTVVWAEQWVPSSLAALIVATLPFFVVGMEAILPQGEPFNLRKVFGIVVGFAGLVVLLWPDLQGSLNGDFLKGILAMFIAPISWGAGSLYSKYKNVKTDPLMSAAFQMLIAGILLTLLGLVTGEVSEFSFNPKGLAALAYLVVFGSILGFTAYIYALAKLPTAIVSTYAYINPVIAVTLGWLVLGERLDWLVVVATVIILLGVVLVKTGSTPPSATTSPTAADDPGAKEEELILDAT